MNENIYPNEMLNAFLGSSFVKSELKKADALQAKDSKFSRRFNQIKSKDLEASWSFVFGDIDKKVVKVDHIKELLGNANILRFDGKFHYVKNGKVVERDANGKFDIKDLLAMLFLLKFCLFVGRPFDEKNPKMIAAASRNIDNALEAA